MGSAYTAALQAGINSQPQSVSFSSMPWDTPASGNKQYTGTYTYEPTAQWAQANLASKLYNEGDPNKIFGDSFDPWKAQADKEYAQYGIENANNYGEGGSGVPAFNPSIAGLNATPEQISQYLNMGYDQSIAAGYGSSGNRPYVPTVVTDPNTGDSYVRYGANKDDGGFLGKLGEMVGPALMAAAGGLAFSGAGLAAGAEAGIGAGTAAGISTSAGLGGSGLTAAEELAMLGGGGAGAGATGGAAGLTGVEAINAAAPGSIVKGLTDAEASMFLGGGAAGAGTAGALEYGSPGYDTPVEYGSPGYSGGNAEFGAGDFSALDTGIGALETGLPSYNIMDILGNARSMVSNLFAPQEGKGGILGNPLSVLSSIGSGIYGMTLAEKQRKLMEEQYKRLAALGSASDPWGTSGGRAGAAGDLRALEADPTAAMAKDPRFAAMVQASQRATAQYGQNSGAMAVAGAQAGGNWYTQRLQELGALAGIGNGGLPISAVSNAGNIAGNMSIPNNLSSQALASIGYGLNTATGGGATASIPPAVIQWMLINGMRG